MNKLVRVDDMTGANAVTYSPSGSDKLSNPIGVAIDGTNRIYICDNANNRIVRIDDITGANRVDFGTVGTGVGQFRNPEAVTLDGSGRIIIADSVNNGLSRNGGKAACRVA